MDIRNINSGSNLPADQLRPDSRDKVDQVEKSSTAENDTEDTSTSTPQDRVEISDAGQMARVDLAPDEVAKLRMAHRALNDLPPLPSDRIDELKERVEDGYYSQPDQIRSTARGLAQELLGMPPEGSE